MLGRSLVGGLAQPRDGLRIVLRHALAVKVHRAEGALREGVSLFGQRTYQPHLRRVVAALSRSLGLVKGSCRRNAKQREREKAASAESFDPLIHGSPTAGLFNSMPRVSRNHFNAQSITQATQALLWRARV